MSSAAYFLLYEPKLVVLSQDERRVVDVLIDVVRLSGQLYVTQVNKQYSGGNLYPHNASKKEIAHAARANPEILSHFTIVQRSHDSDKLMAIPYHLHFHAELREIEQRLKKAYALSSDRPLRRILKVQIQALHTNTYEEALVENMKVDSQRIRFCLGPMEPYEDKLFYRKYGFQSRVSLLNIDLTARCQEIKDVILRHRRIAYPEEQIQFLEKTRVCVEDVIAASGLMVDYNFTGQTLPNRQDLIEKNGAIATIYFPMLHSTFQTFHLGVFQSVFERRFQDGFSRPLLERAFFYVVLLHEISRFLTKFRTGVQRLQGLYPIFNEMLTELLAIRLASYLLLKNVITDKEFEAVLILYICRLFEEFEDTTSDSVLEAYQNNKMKAFVAGNVIMLNVFLRSGSIRHHGGISWPNFVKVFLEIEHMILPTERIFAEGSYQDALRFIRKNESLEGMKRLHPFQHARGKGEANA